MPLLSCAGPPAHLGVSQSQSPRCAISSPGARTIHTIADYARTRAERIPASSDSESPSERASKRPRTRSRKQHRVAKSTPTRNDDDITRLLEGFKNALQDFNRNASGSETADEARRLHGRVNEVKIVVRALKRNWEAKKLGDGR